MHACKLISLYIDLRIGSLCVPAVNNYPGITCITYPIANMTAIIIEDVVHWILQ